GANRYPGARAVGAVDRAHVDAMPSVRLGGEDSGDPCTALRSSRSVLRSALEFVLGAHVATIGGVRTVDARELFAPLGPSYDRVGAALSFGQDPRWRRFLVERLPRDGGHVVDVATGTGLVASE